MYSRHVNKERSSLLTCKKKKPGQLECRLDLSKLFTTHDERDNFDKKWPQFLCSDPYNKNVYQLKGDNLTFLTEQLIPTKTDHRPPLLLVFGNPAGQSVKTGMFFSFEGDGREHRFWKSILRPADVLDLPLYSDLNLDQKNKRRRKQLINLDYKSPFHIGLCVYVSLPSGATGKWSGVMGIQKLIGSKAMRRLEVVEQSRVLSCAKKFITPKGAVITFQKNAWNGLRSDNDLPYSLDLAKKGALKGNLKGMKNIPLLGVPPTRLIGPCRNVLRRHLIESGFKLL